MTTSVEFEAENILPPIINGSGLGAKSRIGAFASAGASTRTNLATYLSDWDDGHFITLVATENLYVFFNNANSGTVDETQVTAAHAGVGWLIPAYSYFHFRIAKDYSWLVHKAAASTTVRVYLSSSTALGSEVF